MTRTETKQVAKLASNDASLRRRRKSVLTCPRCGHTSLVDGDWEVVIRQQGTEVRCPDCYDLLTRRLRFDD